MSTRKQHVLVGLFVALGGLILVGALFSVGLFSELFQREVHVTAHFETVDGLKVGDGVWFSGVPVGKVSGVRLDGLEQVEVRMDIKRIHADNIPASATARVGSDGLIGNRIISLSDGDDAAGPITDGQEVSTEPYVSTEQIMTEFQKTNLEMLEISQNLNALTSKLVDGEGTAGRLLNDEALYDDLVAAVDALTGTAEQVEVVATTGARFARKLDNDDALLNRLLEDETTYPAIQVAIGDVQSAASELDILATRLDDAASDEDTPVGVLLHDSDAGTDVEQTLAQLNEGTTRLSDSLEAIQNSWPVRGMLRRQAKREARAAARDPQLADGRANSDGQAAAD